MAEAASAGGAAGKLVVRNIGLLLSGDLARPILDADTVVAVDGRIAAVGRFKDLDTDHADLVIDARGTCLAPGLIDTPLTDAMNVRLAIERGVTVEKVEAERAQAIPAGRAGTPGEVVSACLFFLSSQSSYCTGTTLHPTGGAWAGSI